MEMLLANNCSYCRQSPSDVFLQGALDGTKSNPPLLTIYMIVFFFSAIHEREKWSIPYMGLRYECVCVLCVEPEAATGGASDVGHQAAVRRKSMLPQH